MSTEHVAIVFVSYNCGADIAQLIRQIDSLPHEGFRLSYVVVDNASTDDSVEQLRALNVDHTTIIPSPVNLGFGAGCNLAFKQIGTCDKVLLLNPDVELFEDSINELFQRFVVNPDAGIWGGVTLNPDGTPDGKSAWREPTLRSVIGWALFLDVLQNIFADTSFFVLRGFSECKGHVDSISGCFLLIDHQLLDRWKDLMSNFLCTAKKLTFVAGLGEMGASPTVDMPAQIVHIGSETVNSIQANCVFCISQTKILSQTLV